MKRNRLLLGALACFALAVPLVASGDFGPKPLNASALQGKPISPIAPTNLQVLQYVSATGKYTPATINGTVTSVALSVPSILSVAGTPIMSSGTLAVTLATQSANRVFAGPTSGGVATPTFRALVAGDVPDLSAVYQPLDADLTALAAAGNSASLIKVGAAEAALNDTAGALAWNPNTTPFAYYMQDINITGITLTAPTTPGQYVTIVLEGAGAFTWANSWTNAVMMAGAWTKPITGQKNAYTLVSTLTAVGAVVWVQVSLAVNLG